MEQVTLEVKTREERGKRAARAFRRDGLVPGVVYGKGRDTTVIAVAERDLEQTVGHGMNVLIDLRIDGKKQKSSAPAMIKELQRHPLTDKALSVDLHWVSLTERIEVSVPLVFEGEPPGVEEGGVAEYQLRELVVLSLPTEIPERITVDVSHLSIGDTIHVGDLSLPESVELRTSLGEPIVSVAVPKVEEEVVPEEAEEVPEEEVPEGEEAPEAAAPEEPGETPAEAS